MVIKRDSLAKWYPIQMGSLIRNSMVSQTFRIFLMTNDDGKWGNGCLFMSLLLINDLQGRFHRRPRCHCLGGRWSRSLMMTSPISVTHKNFKY